jgi:hypothetical protein
MIPSLCEVRRDFRGPIRITLLEISSGRLPVVDVEFTLQRYELGEIAREVPIEIEAAVMRWRRCRGTEGQFSPLLQAAR